MLVARELGFYHRKGTGDIGNTDNHQLRKNHCALYKEETRWKVDCPRLKNKESKSDANITMTDGINSD